LYTNGNNVIAAAPFIGKDATPNYCCNAASQ
jgi:hypothetical protein